jgi:hypothetical protein
VSDIDDDARPYLRALNDQVSDLMAERAIPQRFWPAQVAHVKPALPPAEDGDDAVRR